MTARRRTRRGGMSTDDGDRGSRRTWPSPRHRGRSRPRWLRVPGAGHRRGGRCERSARRLPPRGLDPGRHRRHGGPGRRPHLGRRPSPTVDLGRARRSRPGAGERMVAGPLRRRSGDGGARRTTTATEAVAGRAGCRPRRPGPTAPAHRSLWRGRRSARPAPSLRRWPPAPWWSRHGITPIAPLAAGCVGRWPSGRIRAPRRRRPGRRRRVGPLGDAARPAARRTRSGRGRIRRSSACRRRARPVQRRLRAGPSPPRRTVGVAGPHGAGAGPLRRGRDAGRRRRP